MKARARRELIHQLRVASPAAGEEEHEFVDEKQEEEEAGRFDTDKPIHGHRPYIEIEFNIWNGGRCWLLARPL